MFSVQQSVDMLKALNQRMKIIELQKHKRNFWIIGLINCLRPVNAKRGQSRDSISEKRERLHGRRRIRTSLEQTIMITRLF